MKLNEIQKQLKAPKNQRNTFGKYNYRSCEDILEAVKPLLGTSILTISDKMIEVGGRIYVEATATFQSGDGPVVVTAYAREPESRKGMDESQITGAASSYARKYALNGLFLIDDTKDADTMEPEKPKESAKQKPELTPAHEKWGAIVKHLAMDNPIEDVEKKYRFSAEVREQLLDEAMNFVIKQ